MKKIFIIVILSLSVFSAKGQRQFVNVTHELTQLVFTNEKIQSELERLLLCAKQKIPREFENYKYINLTVRELASSQELVVRLSNYPRKRFFYTAGIGFNIGFFVLQERIVLVHNELPDFLKPTQYKKTFSYREERLFLTDACIEAGRWLVLGEDDTPGWIIEYKDNQLNVISCPINTLLRFQ